MSKKKKDIRDELISLVPSTTQRVLDVGCAGGKLSCKLKDKNITIIGIEKNKKLYNEAKNRLDEVILGDAEKINLSYPNDYFDCILYADILDCFVNPAAVLKKHITHLNEGGYVVASMANIRYYKTVRDLVFCGRWDYKEGGILWKEHLRFFTLANIKELFEGAGCQIIEIKRNIVSSRIMKILNFLLFNRLKNFLVYQYYIKAQKRR